MLASPNRTPLNSDSFHIIAATTYEQAVGRKNTDRKNARANRIRFTATARPSASANVSGTMNSANTLNVSRLGRRPRSACPRSCAGDELSG